MICRGAQGGDNMLSEIDRKKLAEDNLRLVGYSLSLIETIPPELYDECAAVARSTLWDCALKYDESKAKFSTFAVSSIIRRTKSYLSRRREKEEKEREYSQNRAQSVEEIDTISISMLESIENCERVQRVVEELEIPERTLKIFILISEGYSLAEISVFLDVPLHFVKRNVMNTRRKARKVFGSMQCA